MAHDYDPEWDYGLDPNPDPRVKRLVARFLKEHRKLLDAMDLLKPTVYYVANLGDDLAKYIDGTREDLVVVMDAPGIVETAGEHGAGLEDAVETTLLHEYAHAYFDATGENEEMDLGDEEALAEEFTHEYWSRRDVGSAMEVLKRGRS